MQVTVERYNGVSMTLHWLIAAMVAVQFVTKLVAPGSFPGATEGALNAWHLGIGPAILVLMLVRLAWRLSHAVPPPPDDLSTPLRLLSRATH